MMGSHGGFVWYELLTTDREIAKAFYASVVGWRAHDASMPGSAYGLFTIRDVPVAGLMSLPEDTSQTGVTPHWIGYVGVDDVDAAAGRIIELGGAVYVPPTDIPNISRFSVVADPQMATLALVKGLKSSRAQPGGTTRLAPLRTLTWTKGEHSRIPPRGAGRGRIGLGFKQHCGRPRGDPSQISRYGDNYRLSLSGWESRGGLPTPIEQRPMDVVASGPNRRKNLDPLRLAEWRRFGFDPF
jgi:predicted enzyme related to lactoylglutathione lyase